MGTVFVGAWTEIITFIVSIFGNISSVFWTPGVDGAAGDLTFIGYALVITMAISFFSFVFGAIINAIKMRD